MKIKDLVLGFFAIPVLIPIIVIAAIQDRKKLEEELKTKNTSIKPGKDSKSKQAASTLN